MFREGLLTLPPDPEGRPRDSGILARCGADRRSDGQKSAPLSKFCTRCGFVLDAVAALEIDQARAKTDELMKRLTQDPEKLEKLLALIE